MDAFDKFRVRCLIAILGEHRTKPPNVLEIEEAGRDAVVSVRDIVTGDKVRVKLFENTMEVDEDKIAAVRNHYTQNG